MSPLLANLGIDRMSVAEKLELVEAIWDSIPESADGLDIPDWHKEELARRIAAADANPSAGRTWEEVKASLTNRP
jgi:putative addiction module component (TIGR02574 family)